MVLSADHNIAILGTFTYTMTEGHIVYLTNDSPALTGALHCDSSSDNLIYQERTEVAAALRHTDRPVKLLRDTNQLQKLMLDSMVGATNYSDVMSRLGRFMDTQTNEVRKLHLSDRWILWGMRLDPAKMSVWRVKGKDGDMMVYSNAAALVYITHSAVTGVSVTRIK